MAELADGARMDPARLHQGVDASIAQHYLEAGGQGAVTRAIAEAALHEMLFSGAGCLNARLLGGKGAVSVSLRARIECAASRRSLRFVARRLVRARAARVPSVDHHLRTPRSTFACRRHRGRTARAASSRRAATPPAAPTRASASGSHSVTWTNGACQKSDRSRSATEGFARDGNAFEDARRPVHRRARRGRRHVRRPRTRGADPHARRRGRSRHQPQSLHAHARHQVQHPARPAQPELLGHERLRAGEHRARSGIRVLARLSRCAGARPLQLRVAVEPASLSVDGEGARLSPTWRSTMCGARRSSSTRTIRRAPPAS